MMDLTYTEILILTIGFIGQGLFFMRFFVQWLHSEKHRRSLIPTAFWYFSLGGSCLLLTYAILKKDPVFIVGQSTGFLIYTRNLMLIRRERRERPVRAHRQSRSPMPAANSETS